MRAPKRKLIEVALPLETINRESAREKSIRHGHPSTLHLWWARRPLAAARAVLFAQLVDDPSSHPDRFPTEDAQRVERERLHGIIERLVVWENTRDQALLAEAHAEILDSTGGNPPPILDPFAGGGTIPLEAQRLGLEAHASDLNPVAVLINKALIEIPPKFAGRPPVFPGARRRPHRRLGRRDRAGRRRARLRRVDARRGAAAHRRALPAGDARRRDGGDRHRLDLGADGDVPEPGVWDRDAARALVVARQEEGQGGVGPADHRRRPGHPSGKRVEFEIGHGAGGAPSADEDGTVGRNGATCVACGSAVALDVRARRGPARSGLDAQLMAVVAEGNRRRVYLPPDDEHRRAARVGRPESAPEANSPSTAACASRVRTTA